MKKTSIQILFVLLFINISFAGEVIIDFDNNQPKNNISLSDKLTKTENNLLTKTTKNNPLPISKMTIMNDNGEFSIVSPNKTWIDENGNKVVHYIIPPNVQVRWVTECPNNGNWQSKIAYGFTHDKYGGHFHYNPSPPPLKLVRPSESQTWPIDKDYKDAPSPIISPIMDGNKTYYYYVWYPKFGARTVEWKEYYGACGGMNTFYVDTMVKGLVPMDKGSEEKGYWLRLRNEYHPEVWNVVPQVKTQLENMALEWKRVCPKAGRLGYGQMSLPWGGLFDIRKDWDTPHKTHRWGYNADISKIHIRKGNRKKLIKLMCDYAKVQSEGDADEEKPHYHLTFKGSKHPEDFDEKLINCCVGSLPIPQGCIDLENNGAPVDELPTVPIETNCP